MADSYLQGSFAFRCTCEEACLLNEAITALNAIMQDDEPEAPGMAIAAMFAPTRVHEAWSGLVDLMPDPEFPGINADFDWEVAADDPAMASVVFSSMTDFEPLSIAELIRALCQETLTKAPIGFEWAATCSRPRIDEFGGGWCAVFADRIEIENTGRALSRVLDAMQERDPVSRGDPE